MRKIFTRFSILVTALLIALSFSLKAQVILSESFEGGVYPFGIFPPAGWTVVNAGLGDNWKLQAYEPKSGLYSVYCTEGAYAQSNSWLFTPALSFTATNVYRISYWYKLNLPNIPFGLKVTIGSNATVATQNTVIHNYPAVNNATSYLEGVDYFTAPANGNYNIGFNCLSGTGGHSSNALEIDSIVVQQVPVCAGAPSPGVATASASTICGGETTKINLNGNYGPYGLSFQWQSSPKNANTFTDIPNATDTFVAVTPPAASDYRCIVSCSRSGLSSTSNIATVDINPACYCTLAPSNCQFAAITNVTYAGINNTTGCSATGNTYYSALAPAVIYPDSRALISVAVDGPSIDKFISVWIDFDRNGRFDASEYFYVGQTNSSVGAWITVPANATLGITRMRVRAKLYSAFTAGEACAQTGTESEDYNVSIQALTPCIIPPVGGTTISSAAPICPSRTFTLDVTGASISGVAPSYQWQYLNNGVWTDIAGAINPTLVTQQTATTSYRRKITCNNSLFAYSIPYLQAFSPLATCYCIPTYSSCGGITITSVKFGGIDNTTSCGNYVDYTSSVAPGQLTAGTFVPMTVSFTANTNLYGNGYVKAWIDFNQNGIFDNEESFNIAASGSNTTSTALVRIPFDAIGGITRMRVRIENGGFDQMIPCTARTSGETEDYAVNITASPTPSRFFVVYVNKTAAGANNGSTWANALTSLGAAFAMVKSSDTIKVAKGTYTPGYSLTDGVTYLGGYPNTGNPTDAERNFSLNTTILTSQEMFGYQLHSSTMINGFIIDSLSTSYGYLAAIRLENSDPVITNCVFRKNDYRVLYLYNSSPVVSNCFFLNNSDSYVNKGQIQVLNNSNPKIINCVFSKNMSISIITATTNSTVKISNCTFSNNKILNFSSLGVFPQAEITVTANSSANVSNCLFSDLWNGYNYLMYSNLTDSSNVLADNSSTVNVTNSITSFNQTGTNLLRMVDPKFKDSSNAAGADNLFFTADDGFQIINPCSPAMNAGLNSTVQLNTDILGNTRIVSTAVDMGAYEIQSNPSGVPATLYVNALATGNNDGTSWPNAFTNLQSAFLYCSDTIKVAAGTYYPSASDKLMFFALQNKRVFLGGYPNTGNPGDNVRNPAANPTILSGTLQGSGNIKSDNIVQGTLVDSTAVLNGFVIQDAQAGAVYLSYKASPVITNCSITNNAAAAASFVLKQSKPQFIKCTFGNNNGGITINNSTPVIDSCSFTRNYGGSAIANSNRSLSVIKNSTFYANGNSTSGGDIYNDNSDPQIRNCFSDSAYSYFGGSIANVNNSNPVITKCVFTNLQTPNYASVTGGAVCYSNNSKPYFLNCSFVNTKGAGGAFYNTNGAVVKLENCLGYNNTPAGQAGTSFMQNWSSTADIINCTILKNAGGAEVFGNANSSVLNIKNSILWNNNFNYFADIYNQIQINTYNKEITNNTSSVVNISNSITRIYGTNGTNGNMVAIDPRFININNPAGADGIFGTADDGIQLCSCSPAINTGINAAVATSVDITGNPRIMNTIVDRGAYEYQSSAITTSNTSYVNAAATGPHTGASWASAYNNLKEAISNACADTIKIAEGVYKPAVSNRDSAFVIDRKMFLIGGYQNTSNPSEADRDADKYPTILSGEIGNLNDTTDNSYTIVNIHNNDTTVKLDGITIKNCYHDHMQGIQIIQGGGILSVNNQNVLLANCRFTGNYAKNNCSSLNSASSSSLNMDHCVFWKNYSIDGAVLLASNSIISNTVITDNHTVNGITSGMTGYNNFRNCIFYKNSAVYGAGVNNAGISTFVNCNFIENTGTANGGALRNTTRAFILNCIFNNNYTGNGIYADWYDYRGAPDGSSQYYYDNRYFDIKNSVIQTTVGPFSSITAPGNEKFVNKNNPIGPDNKWFTADDGFKLSSCSPLIDKGAVINGVVLESTNLTMPATDILDSLRIKGVTIDLGPYEYPGYFNALINIAATDSVICAGTAVTFTATPTGGGTTPVYQWQVNGINAGTNSSTFTSSVLNNNDKVSVILTSNDPCVTSTVATSNTITMSVNTALVPSVNITTSNTSICQGTSTTFIATANNGGTNPVYQWQVNGINAGTNSNTFTSGNLNNNAQVKVILTSSFACAVPATVTSNIVTITVNPLPIANAGSDVAICAGVSTQLNGSGGTGYSWSPVSGLSNAGIANPVATPTATTAYILTVSNAGNCIAKDTVVVTVNPITPSPTVSISTSNTTICMGAATTFSAVATNAGTNPAYQWSINAVNVGSSNNIFTSTSLYNNDQVKLILTSNSLCTANSTATSNVITMNVQPQLAVPVISLSNRIFTVTNPDNTAAYTWQINANNVWTDVVPAATGITYTATTAGEYRVMVVKGVCTNYSVSQVTSFRVPANNAFGIFLYPNPGNDVVKVDSIKLSQNWETLDIINTDGKHILPTINIKNQTSVIINVTSLIKGTYFFQLRRKDGEFTTIKFVKL